MDLKKMIVRMMEQRGLSKAGLAYALGYKSATSVTRVMDGTCGKESAGVFLQRMLSCAPLALTAEEKRDLVSCLDSRELGEENEGLYDAFAYLLENMYRTRCEPVFRELIMDKAQEACGEFVRTGIVLFNSVDEGLSWEIRRAMEKQPFPITIDHYILMAQSLTRLPGMVKAVLPLLHTSNYRCRTVSIPEEGACRGIFGADAALMTFEYRGGEEKQYLCYMYGDKGAVTIPLPRHVEAEDLFFPMENIRQVNGEGVPNPMEGMDRYLSFCCDLERDHAVYQVKPSLGMEQIPSDILINASMDEEGRLPEDLKGLAPLLEYREKNLLSKKKAQYHVFKEEEMKRFVLTGRMNDHPALLRAFTPPERVRILRRLEDRNRKNSNVHLLFFKEGDRWLDDEVTLYEDAGLSIIKPGTDYSPGGHHSETLLVGPAEFLEAYKSFYLNRLLRARCRDGKESAAILRSLIEEAEKLCEG
ncbi:MAG: hypothetical protein IKP22_00590 [Clostridia bacterium]|nr:hypothetical protein [Clostridia bacterium]